jgi:hypothetical protein
VNKSLSMPLVGTVLVRKNGSRERFLVTHITNLCPDPHRSLVYAAKESAKGNGWHDHAMLLEDLLTEFDVEDDGLGDLDI